MQIALTWAAALFATLASIAWFVSTKTVSREQEIARRTKAATPGESVDLGGVGISDGDTSYDLIATLRHQGKWSRMGAGLAGISAVCQAGVLLLP